MTDIQAQDYGLNEMEEEVFAFLERRLRMLYDSRPVDSDEVDMSIELCRMMVALKGICLIVAYSVNKLADREIMDASMASSLALAGARHGTSGPVDISVAMTQEFIMYYLQHKDEE